MNNFLAEVSAAIEANIRATLGDRNVLYLICINVNILFCKMLPLAETDKRYKRYLFITSYML